MSNGLQCHVTNNFYKNSETSLVWFLYAIDNVLTTSPRSVLIQFSWFKNLFFVFAFLYKTLMLNLHSYDSRTWNKEHLRIVHSQPFGMAMYVYIHATLECNKGKATKLRIWKWKWDFRYFLFTHLSVLVKYCREVSGSRKTSTTSKLFETCTKMYEQKLFLFPKP